MKQMIATGHFLPGTRVLHTIRVVRDGHYEYETLRGEVQYVDDGKASVQFENNMGKSYLPVAQLRVDPRHAK